MPDPKIDPDAVMEGVREYLRLIEGLGEYHTRPDPEENLRLYVRDLGKAAREMAETMAIWIQEEIGTIGYDESGFRCGHCDEISAEEMREIDHKAKCAIGKATTALLTLEALLPTEEEE